MSTDKYAIFQTQILTQLNNSAKYYNFLKVVSNKKAGVQQIVERQKLMMMAVSKNS